MNARAAIPRRGRFEARPAYRFTDHREVVELTEPLVYHARSGRVFRVPTGFRCDLASIPAIFRGLMTVIRAGWWDTAPAGILHDWLYQTGAMPRRWSDALFHEALEADPDPTPRPTAWLVWTAVRAGGWAAWRRWRRR